MTGVSATIESAGALDTGLLLCFLLPFVKECFSTFTVAPLGVILRIKQSFNSFLLFYKQIDLL